MNCRRWIAPVLTAALAATAWGQATIRGGGPAVAGGEQNDRLGAGGGGVVARYNNLYRKLEKGTYLGVLTSPVSAPLRQQLKLSNGVGLMVDHVEGQSPAEQAGLKQYDILRKLNDQLLINNQQLMVLVRTFKAEEQVRFEIIRQGEAMTVTVKLAEKEVPPIEQNNPWGVPMNWDRAGMAGPGQPHAMVTAVAPNAANAMLQDGKFQLHVSADGQGGRTLRAIDLSTGKVVFSGPVNTPQEQKAIPRDIAEKAHLLLQDADADRLELDRALQALHSAPATAHAAAMTYHGEGIHLRITAEKGSCHLLATDKAGKELFNGAIDTPEQRKALPEEVSQQLIQALMRERFGRFALPPGAR